MSSLPAGTVLIVDDDASVREALSSLVRSVGLAVRTFETPDAFLASFDATDDRPACLVLDVRMPGMTGLELQQDLLHRPSWQQRQIPIIFITGHGDIPMTVRAMKAGAFEFLAKPFKEEDLLNAIFSCLRQAESSLQKSEMTRQIQARYDTLTPRERDVLACMVQGLRHKQTAYQLGISEVTVKVHRQHVMEKMQASSLVMLIGMLDRLRSSDA